MNKDSKTRVFSKDSCRSFRVDKGMVCQKPREAVWYFCWITYPKLFSIRLRVYISLVHGLKGGDVGADIFWATLIAEDLERPDIERHRRSCSLTKRQFENVSDLIAWLRSPHLEEAVRAGIVPHPPAPIPSPNRYLARTLFRFADETESRTELLASDLRIRQNLCPCKMKSQSAQ